VITYLLKLRIKQLHRVLNATGYFFVLITAVVTVGISMNALAGFLSLPSWLALPMSLMALSSLHLARRDHQFLNKVFGSEWARRRFQSLEYILILLPILVYQIYLRHWLVAIGLVIVGVVVALLLPDYKLKGLKTRPLPLKFLPVAAFELKIICERYILPLSILWIVSFIGIVHPAFLLVAFLLFLFFIIEAYGFNEPLEMIEEKDSLLLEKCGMHIGLITVLFGVQFLLAGFGNPDFLLILIAGYAYMVIIITLAIMSKYARYNPLRMSNTNSKSLVVAMILGLLPGLILGSLILSVYYYFQAKKNLAYYASG